MQLRLALTIVLSIVLIGIASWTRFAPTQTAEKGELTAVDTNNEISYKDVFVKPLSNNGSTTTDEDLTNTDIISRQIFADYLNLSATGQVSGAGIDSIANKYLDAIPSIQEGFYSSLDVDDLRVVSDTQSNFERYETTVRQIHEKYGLEIKASYPGNSVLTNRSNLTYEYFGSLSSSYKRMAEEIKMVPTPTSLASVHLRLTNNYFYIARAMEALTSSQTDPATSVAAVATISSSMEEQSVIIGEINQILFKNTI